MLTSVKRKQHVLVDPALTSTPNQTKPSYAINWELCVLCQTATDDALQCPARSSKAPVGSGYISLAENLGSVPMDLDLQILDEGTGIQEILMKYSAKFHKTCRLKFNKKALE